MVEVEVENTESWEDYNAPKLFPTGHQIVDEEQHSPRFRTRTGFQTGAYLCDTTCRAATPTSITATGRPQQRLVHPWRPLRWRRQHLARVARPGQAPPAPKPWAPAPASTLRTEVAAALGAGLLALGGYLALAGHRSHLYDAMRRQTTLLRRR